MPSLVQIRTGDQRLLASIDRALAEAARLGGDWLVCRKGCTQCCFGPFQITALDALRLREGFNALLATDPERAANLLRRASEHDESLEDAPCPALDPESGACDLYSARPVTCRVFGPVTETSDGALAACELCYEGATEGQMAQCAVDFDPEGIEPDLLSGLGATDTRTTVARALEAGFDG